MRVEVCIDKKNQLPAGAIEALTNELSKRLKTKFPDTTTAVQVRYASANNLSVLGGAKTDKDLISEILQEIWESADDWFDAD
ncbi:MULTISPECIES: DNA damage-inducible protein I [Yersinia]|jgi:DNA-damage-inducible protein I|uniref:DNA damage-inducible protein I n=1 Tax=Yersinia rochesterensis TaxID=1604335 RepID=A0A386HFL7_9GAMM|nr:MULTISPECIES: DNA damage-inducible protein I [Yersinia]AJI87711.1 DNA-damage-inducible protein I [Yersinia frederiksenii Y225]CNG77735.1 DNA damage-inducible protein I [Yersinia kristensenii]AIN18500.1 DNA-damage-inducible protein I [Yersinia rochesterensis]AJJ34618.1 dinI-like family protein [Yersinia rochesterensis]AYD44399.1 DNA damage-inducible protein I [Yersinia rochesterensis]